MTAQASFFVFYHIRKLIDAVIRMVTVMMPVNWCKCYWFSADLHSGCPGSILFMIFPHVLDHIVSTVFDYLTIHPPVITVLSNARLFYNWSPHPPVIMVLSNARLFYHWSPQLSWCSQTPVFPTTDLPSHHGALKRLCSPHMTQESLSHSCAYSTFISCFLTVFGSPAYS